MLTSWAPFHAGAEVAAERLALGLQAEGYDVLVVLGTEGETLRHMRSVGLRCEFVPMTMTDKWRWWRYADARRQLVSILRKEQPDIVHCNDLPTSQMVGQAAQRLGIPRVCHHRFPFPGRATDWLNKFGAERHLFVSRYLMDEICSESKQIAVAPRTVVYDGLPLPSPPTEADRLTMRRKLELSLDKAIVLFAGQIVERKGVADLIQAWQLISAESRSQAELLIVGDDLQNNGSYRVAMQEMANQIGSPASFCGFQRNVSEWLTAADIAVVPSHVEPLGNATLEAMACCRPVVGCNVGGIPEMIDHDETGLLVEPHNPASLATAIERLISSPEERQRFGAAGRRRCELYFSIEAHTANIVQQYQLTLAAREGCLTS
jgi:glycosyltransferase involved in cell wall biosynthesis